MDATESSEFRQSANTKPSFVDMINILVVDDDATTLAIVSAMLKTWSYQVVAVKNPIDALATLRAQKGLIDLVVTDLHMPHMNGFELQKHIHDEFKLPVIMMSADDKESVILKSLEGGVVYYIVKPVSKDDIKNVWQYAVAAKQGKSVSIEEIVSVPGEAPGEIEDGHSEASSEVDQEKHEKNAAKIKKSRKRGREDDNEERMVAPKKTKVVWTNSLHNQFLQAIRHIGLDKAVPKRILEFMNVPGLTRENVASHLQKYRLFLKRVAEKARVSKCLSERVFRSSIAIGHPALMFNNVVRDQYPKLLQQQQTGNSFGSTFQPSGGINGNTPALTAASNSLGSTQFPNQQAPSSNSMRNSVPQFIFSRQSRLLNNNQANILRQQPILGNGNLLCQANRDPAAFRMQQLMNNIGNGGMSFGLGNNATNNIGLTVTTNNIGTNILMPMFPQQNQARQQAAFTNPFSYSNYGTSGIQNSSNYTPMSPSIENIAGSLNNVNTNQLVSNSSQMMSSGRELEGLMGQLTGLMFNNSNGGAGFSNGYLINNEIVNGLTNGVRNVNLSGAAMGNINGNTNSGYMAHLGASSSSSVGFETSTSSAYQFPPVSSKNNDDQQQNVSVLPQPAEKDDDHQYGLSNIVVGGNIDNTSAAPTLIHNNNISHQQEFDSDDIEDMMNSNLFMDVQQNNYQPPPPPPSQQQGGDQDQLPPDFSSFLYQFGVPNQPTANQVPMNPDDNQVVGPARNQAPNRSADQVPNPDSSGAYHVQENASNDSNEQSWSQQQEGGDQQVLNLEFSSNVFESEDYSIIFDPQHSFQDSDEDFINAILGFGL